MTKIKVKITVIFTFFLAIAGLQAQTTCYEIIFDEGKRLYDEALKLKNDNKCDEAAHIFWAALRRIRLTRRCTDLPRVNDLALWESRCIGDINECGWMFKGSGVNETIERQELVVHKQSITVNETKGEIIVEVTSNVSSWRVSKSPSWVTTVKQGNNKLLIKYDANAGIGVRESEVVITANSLSFAISLIQTGADGNSCYAVGITECRTMFNEAQRLQNAGEKDEASLMFSLVLRKIQKIQQECYVPADMMVTLERMKDEISASVASSGYIIENNKVVQQTVTETLSPISLPGNGGEATITVADISKDWRVVNSQLWVSVRQNADTLIFTSGENPETSVRRDEIIIASDSRQFVIPVEQKAKFKEVVVIDEEEPEEKKEESSDGVLQPFYAALSLGLSSFGQYSLGDINSGGAVVVGLDGAYFFKPYLGAGLKLNIELSNVTYFESKEEAFAYRDMLMFVGPAVFGKWEKDKIVCIGTVGVGALNWRLAKIKEYGVDSKNNEAYTSIGGFISAGVSYMLTEQIGIGLNVQSTLGKITDKHDYERKPVKLGGTLGINIRF